MERTGKGNAIVLLSGGLDSAVTAFMAAGEGYGLFALSFDYGQRHGIELKCAKMIARDVKAVDHRIIKLDRSLFSGSALTGGAEVPKGRDEKVREKEIPVTYVPARNTVFLSLALALAEATGAGAIFIGVHVLDYSGYPDCRPEFIQAFQDLADLGLKRSIEGNPVIIRAPLVDKSKSRIVEIGSSLGVDYSHTTSCYDPDGAGNACGNCDSCLIRKKAFVEAGLKDPVMYG